MELASVDVLSNFENVRCVDPTAWDDSDSIASGGNQFCKHAEALWGGGRATRSQNSRSTRLDHLFQCRGQIRDVVERAVERNGERMCNPHQFPRTLDIHAPFSREQAENDSVHSQPLSRGNIAAHVRDFLRRIHKVARALPDHRKDCHWH